MRTAIVLAGVMLLAAAAPASAATVKRTGPRAYRVGIAAPASPDLSVVRLSFAPGAYSARPTRAPLRVRALGQTGDLTVVAGRLFPWRRTLNALIVVAHRHPRGALYPDIAGVALEVAGARLTRVPRVQEVANAFARRASASPAAPALCRDRAGKVTDAMTRGLFSAGPDLGFSRAHVLAEAYDVACTRAVDPAFDAAFSQFDRCPPPPPPCNPNMERPCPVPVYAPCPPEPL